MVGGEQRGIGFQFSRECGVTRLTSSRFGAFAGRGLSFHRQDAEGNIKLLADVSAMIAPGGGGGLQTVIDINRRQCPLRP